MVVGIFAVDGEKWIQARKATSKIFSANNFRGIIATSIDEDLATLRQILGRHADSGEGEYHFFLETELRVDADDVPWIAFDLSVSIYAYRGWFHY